MIKKIIAYSNAISLGIFYKWYFHPSKIQWIVILTPFLQHVTFSHLRCGSRCQMSLVILSIMRNMHHRTAKSASCSGIYKKRVQVRIWGMEMVMGQKCMPIWSGREANAKATSLHTPGLDVDMSASWSPGPRVCSKTVNNRRRRFLTTTHLHFCRNGCWRTFAETGAKDVRTSKVKMHFIG